MPRNPRSYVQTSFFHVMTQGINKSYIFERTEDVKFYINLLKKLEKEQAIEVMAYCVMNNHTHLLLRAESISELSKFMQRLNTKYAKYYNTKYNRVGYVFRDRYRSEGIYSEEQLYNCIQYIYNNLVKAKICIKPEDYPYSSYKSDIIKTATIEYKFIEIEDDTELMNNIINEFLLENDIKIDELLHNKNLLKQLLVVLKIENRISFRKISQQLNISRETLRKLCI